MIGQKLQETVFSRRELNVLVGPLDGFGGRVDRQILDMQDGIFDLMTAPDQGTNSCEKFIQFKRFCQVIIRAEVKPMNLVVQSAASTEDNNVCLNPRRAQPSRQSAHPFWGASHRG